MYSTLKVLGSVLVVLTLASCTVYTLKDSEVLSQAIYHADDSFDKGRFDLTDSSLDQAVRIARPPKERIPVEDVVVKKTTTANSTTQQRVVIVPSRFGTSPVIVVGSTEYEGLLKNKEILKQLERDHFNLKNLKTKVDLELITVSENAEKMTADLNSMQTEVAEKNAALWQRNLIIVGLVGTIAAGIYLRIKGIL